MKFILQILLLNSSLHEGIKEQAGLKNRHFNRSLLVTNHIQNTFNFYISCCFKSYFVLLFLKMIFPINRFLFLRKIIVKMSYITLFYFSPESMDRLPACFINL